MLSKQIERTTWQTVGRTALGLALIGALLVGTLALYDVRVLRTDERYWVLAIGPRSVARVTDAQLLASALPRPTATSTLTAPPSPTAAPIVAQPLTVSPSPTATTETRATATPSPTATPRSRPTATATAMTPAPTLLLTATATTGTAQSAAPPSPAATVAAPTAVPTALPTPTNPPSPSPTPLPPVATATPAAAAAVQAAAVQPAAVQPAADGAAVVRATDGDGIRVGDGTPDSCTDAALAGALAVGGHIHFNCGAQPVIIYLNRQLTVSRDTVLDGGNLVTLDGRQAHGILRTERYLSLTVRNLRLQNGRTPGQGGAIDLGFWSNLTVLNSSFVNNVALKNDAACDGGGAIFVGGGSLAHIENSLFEGNRANNGGAVNNLRSGLTVLNSRFNNNHALHSDFINQFGDCGGGGALYIDATRKPEDGGPDPIIVRGSVFTNNTTNNHGGAIFVAVHPNEQVEIGYSTFEGNKVFKVASMPTSGTGGAIWYGKAVHQAVGNSFLVYASAFVNNHADTQGGGLWTSLPLTVRNSTFTGNTAVNPAALDRDDWRKGNGGAIAVAHQVLVILESNTIVGNRAGFNGGGVVGENIAARNTIIANNVGDWYLGLQQNCTHALQNWGGNLQFLAGHAQADHRHPSNCGSSIAQGDPLPGALRNGTLPLQPGSAAIDSGDSASCPAVDQRGVARPQGAGCDSGAYEYQP